MEDTRLIGDENVPLVPSTFDRRKANEGEDWPKMMREISRWRARYFKEIGSAIDIPGGEQVRSSRTIAVSHFVRDLVGIKANVAMRYVTKMNQMPRVDTTCI